MSILLDRTKGSVLLAVCSASFAAFLSLTVIYLSLTEIRADLGVSATGQEWLILGYALPLTCLLLSGGTLGDLFGRKRVFLTGLAVFTVGSVLGGMAGSYPVLLAARVLQGCGAALFLPTTLSLLSNVFHDAKERATAISAWAAVQGLAIAAGPIIGGLLLARFSWHSVFFINVPLCLIGLGLTAWLVPESSHRAGRGLDLVGQALAVATLGPLTYAIVEAETYGWTSLRIVALLAIALAAGIAFIGVERRSASPMLHLEFFRNRAYSAAAGVNAVLMFAMMGSMLVLVQMMMAVQGYSALETGLRILPLTLMTVVAALVAGRASGRGNVKLPMVLGMAALSCGMLLLTTIDTSTSYLPLALVLALVGGAIGLVMTPVNATIMHSVPKERSGMAAATGNAALELGGVLGVSVLGTIFQNRYADQLSMRLDGLGLTGAVKAQVTRAIESGRGASGAADDALGPAAHAVLQAASGAFSSALHVTFAVSACVVAVGALAALLFVRAGSATAPLRTSRQSDLDAVPVEQRATVPAPAPRD